MSNVSVFAVPENTPLREALVTMDREGEGFLVVIGGDRAVKGVIADGDVRRALIHGHSLDEPVGDVMNREFKFSRQSDSREKAMAYLRTLKCRQLPVLDGQGRLVDILFSDHLTQAERPNPVVIMAGGLGTRLRPITETIPKPMLKVNGKPFLETTLENLVAQGFRSFHFCVNYLAEQITEHFGDGRRWGVRIDYVREKKPLGTAGALALIDEIPQVPALVMNADLMTRLDFGQLLDHHAGKHNVATMAVRSMEFQVPFGVVETEGERVSDIVEKPVRSYLVNAGIYVLDPAVFSNIPKGEHFDMPELFQSLISQQRPVGYFPLYESWLDIGRIEDYQRALRASQSRDDDQT
jgi:dTDP-glucose pyrophosphorylase